LGKPETLVFLFFYPLKLSLFESILLLENELPKGIFCPNIYDVKIKLIVFISLPKRYKLTHLFGCDFSVFIDDIQVI